MYKILRDGDSEVLSIKVCLELMKSNGTELIGSPFFYGVSYNQALKNNDMNKELLDIEKSNDYPKNKIAKQVKIVYGEKK